MVLVTYDVEVYRKYWCVTFKNNDTKSKWTVDTVEELRENIDVMRDANCILIGYNNAKYDNWVLSYLYDYGDKYIYHVSKTIITKNHYRAIQDYNIKPLKVISYDLLDNLKFTNRSLKELEGYAGKSIVETSVPFDKLWLTDQDRQEIREYNIYDVDFTDELLDGNKALVYAKLALLQSVSLKANDLITDIGVIMGRLMESEYYDAKDELDPIYHELFDLLEDKEVIDFYNQPIIYSFPDLDKHGNQKYDKNGKLMTKANQLIKNMFGLELVFAFGGIHGAVPKYQQTPNTKLVMADVTSYYPNLVIRYNLFPRGAKKPEVYEHIYNERVRVKALKKDEVAQMMAEGLKLPLNKFYGLMGAMGVPVGDKRMRLLVCVYGQMFLAVLAKWFYDCGYRLVQLTKWLN